MYIMRENYNFEYRRDRQRRLQFSVICGSSYRYLWHTELEMMVVLSGELEYYAGGEHYPLHRGDILFFNQNCGHSIISTRADNRTVSLKLHPQVLQNLGVCAGMSRPCFCITAEQVYSELALRQLRGYVAGIYFYIRENGRFQNRLAEILAVLAFMDILQRYGLLHEYTENGTKSFEKSDRISVINNYIESHLAEPITLENIAEATGYNKTYLSGQFKQWTGFNLSNYVKQMRIQRAISLLESRRSSLTDIALESGFSDYNTFSSCMLQYCGRKPQEYRNSIRQNGAGNVQRHFAAWPDSYIEQCLCSLLNGGIYDSSQAEQRLDEIASHAKAILSPLENQ